MSIINYETDLANDKELKPNESLLKIENSLEDENKIEGKDDNFIADNKYSKYAFIKLGENFSSFREMLDQDEYKVFLPGGVAGEHAIFTIFENTIRNIKHYKNGNCFKQTISNGKDKNGEDLYISPIVKNGIDLYISLDKANIEDDSNKKSEANNERSTYQHELFKVSVWLNHEIKLYEEVTNEKGNGDGLKKREKQTKKRYLKDKVAGLTGSSIVNELGNPRMGGNSQDKACAAMLFNNKFGSVEEKKTGLERVYYPWVTFATAEIENPLKNVKELDYGVLKKYFHLWKSDDIFVDEGKDDNIQFENTLKINNVSRFKFFVSNNQVKEERLAILRKYGIVRMLDQCDPNDSIAAIYKSWLKKWLNIDLNYNSILLGFLKEFQSVGAVRINESGVLTFKSKGAAENFGEIKCIRLSHGAEQDIDCNVRSHGFFRQFFFKKDVDKLADYKINVDEKDGEIKKLNESILAEFLETALTKITIFDNRIKQRFTDIDNKTDMFKKQLNLEVFKESDSEWENWKNSDEHSNFNILVMHLSFVESLKDKEEKKYGEKRINEFIEDEILNSDQNQSRDNFTFVITSGRGREAWWSSIESESKYAQFTIFKPIESLLTAVESGISYNDHFDVKYNLTKVLLGS